MSGFLSTPCFTQVSLSAYLSSHTSEDVVKPWSYHVNYHTNCIKDGFGNIKYVMSVR